MTSGGKNEGMFVHKEIKKTCSNYVIGKNGHHQQQLCNIEEGMLRTCFLS
jgi:hypothetical protein